MSQRSPVIRDLAWLGSLGLVLFLVYVAENWLGFEGSAGIGNSLFQKSPFAGRTPQQRKQLVQQYGGTPQTEAAAEAGLDWLARHQCQDGAWSSRCLAHERDTQCETAYCSGAGLEFDMAQTGLAVLAFQAGGHFFNHESRYSEHVRRGLDWIVEHQEQSGCLKTPSASDHHLMYEHGIATFALAEACAIQQAENQTADPRYRRALERALAFLISQQHQDGGWRYDRDLHSAGSDTSVTGWAVLALKTARDAGLDIPPSVINGAKRFVESCAQPDGQTFYAPGQSVSYATTGVGMLVPQFLLKTPDVPHVDRAADFLVGLADAGRSTLDADRALDQPVEPHRLGAPDYYTWYNCTLGMFQVGGDRWKRWNDVVLVDVLPALQVREGCERGSWPPSDPYGTTGGRAYSTALAVLTLEVYYRYTRDEKD